MEQTKFRIRARDLAVTFPQCPASPESVFAHFKQLLDDKYSYLAVVRELHADGNPHLHMQVQFLKEYSLTSTRNFDLTYEGATYHPNIQKTKDSASWRDYLAKAASPLVTGEFAAIYSSKKKTKPTNKELLEEDPQFLVDTGRISLFSLPGLLNARKVYQEISKSTKPNLPAFLPENWEGLSLPVLPRTTKQRHYWIWSSLPNKGKSTFLKLLYQQYRADYYSCSEKYQSMRADSELVLFDEFGKGNSVTITYLNQMCDGTYAYPCKGRPAVTLPEPYIVIASNFDIATVYPNSNGRVEARFIEIRLDDYLFKN